MTTTTIRTYHEMIMLPTFRERFEYLKLDGGVGRSTFGADRYINQIFYKSEEWRQLRRTIIIRDRGCDLAMSGYDIGGKVLIHHMNPIEITDILQHSDYLLNPDFLVCVSLDTHNGIHYGDVNQLLPNEFVERTPNDTCPWK